jgi:hypothetical protein
LILIGYCVRRPRCRESLHSCGDSHGSILTLRLLPLPSLNAFSFEILRDSAKSLALLLQSLALDLQITRLLRDLELLRIQSQDLCRVVRRVVLRECVAVICGERLVGA